MRQRAIILVSVPILMMAIVGGRSGALATPIAGAVAGLSAGTTIAVVKNVLEQPEV